MTGRLPVTTTGHPSYSLAKARIKERADELLWALQDEYGLTDLEMADVLSDIGHSFLRGAVSDQQESSKARAGAIGTPREDDGPPCAPCSSAAGEEIWHGPLGCPHPETTAAPSPSGGVVQDLPAAEVRGKT